MHRRSFLGSCATGAVAGALVPAFDGVTRLEAMQPSVATRALAALRAAKQQEATGNGAALRNAYHSDAIVVEPSSLKPLLGRASGADLARRNGRDQRLLYFYYRQPQVVSLGNAALVVSNYEAGYTINGKTIEDTGKSTNVVLLGANPPLIAQEVVIPNLYAGSYGALGSALAKPRFGIYPLRALGRPTGPALSAGGGENDVLFSLVRRINSLWVSNKPAEILQLGNPGGVFLVGDYSPYYITGTTEITEHFADFYKTGRVNAIRELNPSVRIWGDAAAVAFDFDLDYVIGNRTRKAPGRAVYTFGKQGTQWTMAACAASHLVISSIGDPYPLPNG
jgi:hypothetical protein